MSAVDPLDELLEGAGIPADHPRRRAARKQGGWIAGTVSDEVHVWINGAKVDGFKSIQMNTWVSGQS